MATDPPNITVTFRLASYAIACPYRGLGYSCLHATLCAQAGDGVSNAAETASKTATHRMLAQ